jgi:uncharacterized protein YjiS (DUF1127 family)
VDERLRIRTLRAAFDQQVNVIRHEAVRNQFDIEKLGGLQNVLQHQLDDIGLSKQSAASSSAKG